jgi:hypothetical protein
MGTRGLTKVIYKNQVIVAQYGQWDHYPEGQGVTLFHTLTNPDVVKAFIEKIPQIYYPSDADVEALVKPFEDGTMDGMMTFESGDKFSEKYPTLTRNTGGEIFRVIADWDDSPIPIVRDLDFEKDELFCEGVYVVDLDNELFTTKFGRHEGSWDIHLVLHFESIREMKSHEDYLNSCKEATLVK